MIYLHLEERPELLVSLCHKAQLKPELLMFAVTADQNQPPEQFALFAKVGEQLQLKTAVAHSPEVLDGLVRAGLNSALTRRVEWALLPGELPKALVQQLERLGFLVGQVFHIPTVFCCYGCQKER